MNKLIQFISKFKPRHFICLFFLYLIYLPFQPWIIAEITTPIRAKMIEKDAIKIYVKPDEWRRLRGIITVATSSTPPLEWISLREVEHSDVEFPKSIEFEGRKYEAGFIDKKTGIILYDHDNRKARNSFGGCVLGTSYYLYYDPIINKTIASVKDVFGLYPLYLAGGYNNVGELDNYLKLVEFLQKNYNF
ncbi:hypothetical protein [Spirabiliibacterium falconis]|uniref:hypothetical protein n=1 Tax=Spirabiliibacterium falconis TaxID=572023 RepID=UPI001AAD497F|nr:hypothetical protein [Spirabiliibacterium falconis]MBE2893656.1 hypothetical protein [Spirabiliibacterium falconis]